MSFGNAASPRPTFVRVQALSSGLNEIRHNLSLDNPLTAIVHCCDATSKLPCRDAAGKVIDFGVVLQTRDSLQLRSSTIVTNVQIVVIG
jgi:hypothetical protein